jgi:hypothetical protein
MDRRYFTERAWTSRSPMKGLLHLNEIFVNFMPIIVLSVKIFKVEKFPSSISIVLDEVKTGERESSIWSLLPNVAV